MPAKREIEEEIRTRELFHVSEELNETEINKVREKIKTEQENLDLRIQLSGYLCENFRDSKELETEYCQNIIWWIQTHPEHHLMSYFDVTHPRISYRNALKVYAAWDSKADENAHSVSILMAAAAAFDLDFKAKSEKLYLKAKAISPDDKKIAHCLSELYSRWGSGFEQLSLDECMREIVLCEKSKILNIPELPNVRVAELAYEAKDFELAVDAANNVLKAVENNIRMFCDMDASHRAHTVLGKIAMRKNNLSSAVEHLFDSLPGKIPHRSFRPDFSLLSEINQAGEKGAVKRFLGVAPLFQIELMRFQDNCSLDDVLQQHLPSWQKYTDLASLPRSAFDSGRFEMAKNAAVNYQEMSIKLEEEPDYGVHIGETVLGQIELKQGNITKAIEYLQNSLSRAGHMALDCIDTHLCLDLMKLEKKEPVLNFLKECQMLFADDTEAFLLDEWISQIEQGEIPWEWTV